jgi:hypothetical protein
MSCKHATTRGASAARARPDATAESVFKSRFSAPV